MLVAAGLAVTIASPVRRASAMIVIIGLVPLDVGNALASPMLLLVSAQPTRPQASTRIVTGPSLTSDTRIRAPKTPPWAPSASRTRS